LNFWNILQLQPTAYLIAAADFFKVTSSNLLSIQL